VVEHGCGDRRDTRQAFTDRHRVTTRSRHREICAQCFLIHESAFGEAFELTVPVLRTMDVLVDLMLGDEREERLARCAHMQGHRPPDVQFDAELVIGQRLRAHQDRCVAPDRQ
jgi:hypothetical protein